MVSENGQVEHLEQTGIRKLDDGGLFIVGAKLGESLLRQTKWAGLDVDGILARLPGAERKRLRFAGGRAYGVLLPTGVVDEICSDDSDSRPAGTADGTPEGHS